MLVERKFESSSSSSVYTTRFDTATGRGTCDCPGWTRRAVRECKHTKALAAETSAPRPAPTSGTLPFDRAAQVAAARVALDRAAPAIAAAAKVALAGPPAVKPMLASAMKEDQSLETFATDDWTMEEKFDGHRLMVIRGATETSGWSRPGHDRASARRDLPAGLLADLAHLPEGTYDGELYIPGGTSSDVVRLDRKDELVYAVFDAVELLGQDLTARTLAERRKLLEVALAHAPAGGRVRLAAQGPVSMDTVRAIWAAGGEGAIVKRLASTYRSGWRTPDWVKVKKIAAAEMTVVGFEAGKMGPHSVWRLRHDDGRETTAKVLGNDWLRRVDADPDRYIGKRMVISFMGMTPGGLWRHPQQDHFLDEDANKEG